MKYQSELVNKILEQRGHEKSSFHYESECVETWIGETKGAYPKLCDYEGEWLNYILEETIGDFPYETITDVTEATVNNVVPYAYKSAILKGSTKYRDIDTGEILETFEEGRNLELVSVKMPVLTTVGKNLFDKTKIIFDKIIDIYTGVITDYSESNVTEFIKVIPNTQYTMSFNFETKAWTRCFGFTEAEHGKYATDVNKISDKCYFDSGSKKITFTTSPTTKYLIFMFGKGVEESFQLEQGSTATPYEPYKSNILTVNEDVTLRSNGDVCDELNLLTGRLTQRIDENNEVLAQEVVKTVDLNIIDQSGNKLNKIKPLEGTMNIKTDGTPLKPTVSMEIPVEAITQNLSSFIEEK